MGRRGDPKRINFHNFPDHPTLLAGCGTLIDGYGALIDACGALMDGCGALPDACGALIRHRALVARSGVIECPMGVAGGVRC